VPFLLGLACASNVGSAATLIGNPQNMLIGQTFSISFTGYLRTAAIPAALGLVAVWAVLCIAYRGRWERECAVVPDEERPKPDRGQTVKGLLVAAGLLAAFLFAPWPREVVSLSGAAILLTSRRLHTRRTLGYVDWQVLVLFIGLFVVNDALARTGMPARVVDALAASGFDLARAEWLFAVTAILSNVVSNVPAVMLLLPLCGGPAAGPDLALASTLAGNLLVVGSIANILVVDIAARRGIPISWRAHARIGIPVTLVTLLLAVAWRVATA
jgi:Na+/H+ antiporter NhaD/arsenite permease-like protein